MARQGHQGSGEPAVERASRKRRDTGRLHRTVEGLVIVAEPVVVRSVPRLVHVQQRDDQSRTVVRPSDAARRLDVLGVHLRLAEHQHQSQARDVETDRDHVRRQRAVDAVVSIVEQAFEPPPRRRHLVGRHASARLSP